MGKKLHYLSNKNGFLGIDNKFNFKEKVVIIPFGLEKTVSYGRGTKNGPKEIIKASHQVELYDEELNCEPYKKIGIKTLKPFKIDKNINKELKKIAIINKKILNKNLFPIKFEEDFETKYNLDDWTEFRILKYNILVLANSISGYNDNDAKYLEDILNKLGNNSREVLKSDFDLFISSPEIKGRLKLLDIQIQKTKHNISNLNKSEGLEELNKIFVFYNYSANMIESILVDSIN